MKQTDLARYLTQYLTVYLPSRAGVKKNTIIAYRDAFSLLLEYCRDVENIPPEKITIADLTRERIFKFLNWLQEVRSCKVTSRNHRLAAIRSFFSFLAVEAPEYLEHSQIILSIPMKKTDKPPLKYLTLENVEALLKQPDRSKTLGKRDAVMLSLIYDSGARVQEIIDLTYGNIVLNDTVTISLTEKGGKTRTVPLMTPTGNLLKQYITILNKDVHRNCCEIVFLNRSGKKFTRAGITFILQKYVDLARQNGAVDMPQKVTPHWLRHSKAMHLLQAGVNLIYIRDLLGHADVSTTEIYARADEKMKLEALKKAYENPTNEDLPSWKKDNDLLDWLKSL